jgi:hypothetical protein
MSFAPLGGVADADYLLQRVEAEAKAADQASSEAVAEAHHKLASGYLGLLFDTPSTGKVRQTIAPNRRRSAENRTAMASLFAAFEPVGEASDFTDLLLKIEQSG